MKIFEGYQCDRCDPEDCIFADADATLHTGEHREHEPAWRAVKGPFCEGCKMLYEDDPTDSGCAVCGQCTDGECCVCVLCVGCDTPYANDTKFCLNCDECAECCPGGCHD